MHNPEILYMVVEAEHKVLMKEAEMHRRQQAWLKDQSTSSGPKLTLALIVTSILAVLVILAT
jgi:hypothetical protein